MNEHTWDLTNATLELANQWLRENQNRVKGDELRTDPEMVMLRALFKKLHQQRIACNVERLRGAA